MCYVRMDWERCGVGFPCLTFLGSWCIVLYNTIDGDGNEAGALHIAALLCFIINNPSYLILAH